ncbi:MAG: MoxR family ATPase, partial [Gemmatimonadaceae bacterium]
QLARDVTALLQSLRRRRLAKVPGVSESLDWAAALVALHADHLDETVIRETMGCFLKDDADFRVLEKELADGKLAALTSVPV